MKTLSKIWNKFILLFNPQGENNFTSGKSWDEKQEDLGAFQYSIDGFIFSYEKHSLNIKWEEITELNAYITNPGIPYEETTIEIVHANKVLTISESIPGWYQFVSRTKVIFQNIPKNWDIEINTDDGQSNYQNIYKKK